MKPADPVPEAPTHVFREREPHTIVPDTLVTPLPPQSGAIVADDATMMSGTYLMGEVIGRGGMGEVLLAHDRKIGRDVAYKRLRAATPGEEDVARFLREARIQARLEHPAIAPVYELARDATGRPFFTMKRLAGSTLVEVLRTATRQRLLRAFAEVCRAVDFAHSRGVVHRDLKPANIVLGEFGEVYVLDWGVARVLGDSEEVLTADIDTLEGSSPPHQILGTPGYLAPEQAANPNVGRPADVYSLGAILFEILAGEPVHPRNDPLASTLSERTIVSPLLRRQDRMIAPELDALCAAMLATNIQRRPTARQCAERIEEYLDGDRDFARRTTIAAELVRRANQALAAGDRADAMRTASRALALDANVDGAAEIVTALMLEPPKEVPRELRRMLRAADADDISRHARAAIPGYLLIAGFLPIILVNGVTDWAVVTSVIGIALVMAVAALALVRHPIRTKRWMIIYAIGNAAILLTLARLAGAFTFVPALVATITASLITYPTFIKRPALLTAIMLAGFLVPVALEFVGLLPETWQLRDDGILITGGAMRLGGRSALVSVVLASVATVVMAAIQSWVLGRAKRDAQHKLVTQAWHLRQLLPLP
jgi:eukaryotic-like serine/threonine-protein kinase